MDKHPVMGELLLMEGLLTKDQLSAALEAQRHEGGRLGYHLIRLGFVNVQRLSQFLRESMGLIPYDLTQWISDPTVTEILPANIAQFYQVVPVEKKANVLTVAIADLDNPSLVPALEELTGLTIDPLVCPRETVIRALEHFYGVSKDPGVVRNLSGDHLFVLMSSPKRIRPLHWSTLKPDSSATDWLRTSLAEAIRSGCRTLYIKPGETSLKIAFKGAERVEDRFALHPKKREEMDALLRELARIRDTSHGARLEGRVRLQVDSRFLTAHVKGLATLQGTRYTLTLYDERYFLRDWEKLSSQLNDMERANLGEALRGGSGLVLLCGAPSSGLNQVFYALMASLKENFQPAVSLEEYALLSLDGVAQLEVSRQEDSTWPELMAMALKQEPNLFACFPIKERTSMELAFLAAAHTRVMGVLHQPNATAALRWLYRNQFRSPMRAGVLKGILTVASVPELCPDCRLPLDVAGREGRTYSLYTRQGCENCLTWESLPTQEILEWFRIDAPTRAALEKEMEKQDVHRLLVNQGGVPLEERVLQRCREGRVDGQEAQGYLP